MRERNLNWFCVRCVAIVGILLLLLLLESHVICIMYIIIILHRNIIHFRGIFEGDLKDLSMCNKSSQFKLTIGELFTWKFLMNFQKFYDNPLVKTAISLSSHILIFIYGIFSISTNRVWQAQNLTAETLRVDWWLTHNI